MNLHPRKRLHSCALALRHTMRFAMPGSALVILSRYRAWVVLAISASSSRGAWDSGPWRWREEGTRKNLRRILAHTPISTLGSKTELELWRQWEEPMRSLRRLPVAALWLL